MATDLRLASGRRAEESGRLPLDPGDQASLADLVMPEGSETESAELARCALKGEPLEAEVRRETANGRRDFLLRGVPIRQGETVTGGCAVYTDITGRKRREQ
jgi:PAS domain S-box-containing protein